MFHNYRELKSNQIDYVSYIDEIGVGDGIRLDYFTRTFESIVTKLGTEMNLFYLPPSNDMVQSNPQIAEDLVACGRLMQMAMIHCKKDTEIEEPQFAAWVKSLLLLLHSLNSQRGSLQKSTL